MLTYRINTDFSEVKRYLTDVQKKYVPRAAGTALGRVGNTVRSIANRKIRQRLAISAAVASGAITMRRAGMQRLAVYIQASGAPIPLRDYQARQTKKGATFRVIKAGPRRRYQREGRSAFIVKRFGSHVFVRVEDDPPGKAKGRMKKVYGPSIPQYFVTKAVIQLMEETASKRWPIEFHAALRGILIRRTSTDIGVL